MVAVVAANRARQCPRPVLRGQATTGAAADDIVAVLEGTPATQACLQALDAHGQALHQAMVGDGSVEIGWPARADTPVSNTPAGAALAELFEACAPTLALMSQATQHEDGCSPYRAGVRAQPATLNAALPAMKLAAVVARDRLLRGEFDPGFDLALDAFRFGQDLIRGGVSLLQVVVASVTSEFATSVVELGLSRPQPLGEARLTRIEGELATLLATAPHPSSYLAGQREHVLLYTLMPRAKGAGWTPPGGWGAGEDEGARRARLVHAGTILGVDQAVLEWMAWQRAWEQVLSRCTPEAAFHRCRAELDTARSALLALPVPDDQPPGGDSTVRDELVRAQQREQTIQILTRLAVSTVDSALARDARLRFRLAGLRLYAAHRRAAESAGDCPGLAWFDADDQADARRDPGSGAPMAVEALGKGRFVLRPAATAAAPDARTAQGQPPPAVFVRCPPASPR
ncbi:hypothetical protein [Haliangium sp.]|uniref:hypothetical protein n=1 Tax=Haliangium sp. TaxID=2663208 RepID=UPI003D09C481